MSEHMNVGIGRNADGSISTVTASIWNGRDAGDDPDVLATDTAADAPLEPGPFSDEFRYSVEPAEDEVGPFWVCQAIRVRDGQIYTRVFADSPADALGIATATCWRLSRWAIRLMGESARETTL